MNVLKEIKEIIDLVTGHQTIELEACKDVLATLTDYQPAEGETFYQNNGVFYAGDTLIIPTRRAVYVCPFYSCDFGSNGGKRKHYKEIESGHLTLSLSGEAGEEILQKVEYNVSKSDLEGTVLIAIGDSTYELGLSRDELLCDKFSEWFESRKKGLWKN